MRTQSVTRSISAVSMPRKRGTAIVELAGWSVTAKRFAVTTPCVRKPLIKVDGYAATPSMTDRQIVLLGLGYWTIGARCHADSFS